MEEQAWCCAPEIFVDQLLQKHPLQTSSDDTPLIPRRNLPDVEVSNQIAVETREVERVSRRREPWRPWRRMYRHWPAGFGCGAAICSHRTGCLCRAHAIRERFHLDCSEITWADPIH